MYKLITKEKRKQALSELLTIRKQSLNLD